MTLKPNLVVKEGLDHLAKRLDPIIASRLAVHLGGHPWTTVLQILDEKKGRTSSYEYWTYDLQAQLRVLTERLGDLGFPFDDRERTVSTLGNELRIVRKQMAHMHDFNVEEAFRATDYCVRLLEYFKDTAGLKEATRIRYGALVALAEAEGIAERPSDRPLVLASPSGIGLAMGSLSVAGAVASNMRAAVGNAYTDEAEPELVQPDPSVMTQKSSLIGDKRLEFEPWSVVPVGGIEVLDALPKKVAKEQVRAVATEIVSFEGPIHLDRLVQLTAQSFGLQRVRSSREKKIAYQVQQTGLYVDADRFVWPADIDPTSWQEFRPNDSTVDRPFTDISPVEIANAARLIMSQHPDRSHDELAVAVLQTFGRRRRTKRIGEHLDRALAVRPEFL